MQNNAYTKELTFPRVFYQQLLENAIFAIFISKNDFSIIYANKAFHSLFQYSPEQLLTKSVVNLISDSTHGTIARVEGKPCHAMGIRPNGEKFSITYCSSPIWDDEIEEEVAYNTIIEPLGVAKIKFEEELKDTLLNAVGQAVIATDTNGIITFWNKAATDLYGWNEAEALNKNILDVTPSEPTKQQAAEIMKQLSAGNSWSGEFVVKKKDRDSFPAFVTNTPIVNARGKLIGIIGVSANLSGVKKAEREMSLLLHNTEESFILLDKELKIISFNDQYKNLYQNYFNKEVIKGHSILEYVQQERLPMVKEIYQKVLAGSKEESEVRISQEDGTNKILSIRFKPAKNEADVIIGVFVTGLDITEKIEAEKKFNSQRQLLQQADITWRESEEKYSNLFNLSPQPMWVFEISTLRFLQVNKAAVDLYGYSEQEFLAMTIIGILPVTEIKKTIAAIKTSQEMLENFFSGTFKHKKKSGEWIDVEVYSSSISMNNTECKTVIAIDITEKNKTELRLTNAIIKAQEDERYEIGGELHDNICQVLAGTQLTLRNLKSDISPAKLELYNNCMDYIKIALDEIRNLSHRLAPAFFDNANLEDSFQQLLRSFNTHNQFEVKFSFDKSVIDAHLKRDLQLNLYRILQEQLNNITKYSQATEVEVMVNIEERNFFMLTGDNGVGFDTMAAKNGIGLANMKRRVELFYGSLSVNSSPGNGCIIIVRIPEKFL